jgi:PPM family protein phosphatase
MCDKIESEAQPDPLSLRTLQAHSIMTSNTPPDVSDQTAATLPQFVVRSETNQRDNNEDSFLVISFSAAAWAQPIYLLALADGMGGHEHGEHVSAQTLKKLSLSLFEQLIAGNALNNLTQAVLTLDQLKQAIVDALMQVNSYILRMVQANHWAKSGSTIVLAVILNNQAVIANLGDSPLYHFDAQNQKLQQITQDHTVAGMLLHAGMISPEMARVHEGKSQLQYFIGCDQLPKELPLSILTLQPGDQLLLCSDGINGSLDFEQIEHILNHAESLDSSADELLRLGQANQETDNQTLILWQQPQLSPPPPSVRVSNPMSATIPSAPYLSQLDLGATASDAPADPPSQTLRQPPNL